MRTSPERLASGLQQLANDPRSEGAFQQALEAVRNNLGNFSAPGALKHIAALKGPGAQRVKDGLGL